LYKQLDLYLKRIASGILPGINFDAKSASLTADSSKSLDYLGKILQKHPGVALTLVGYSGAPYSLGQARANQVMKYLGMNFRIDLDTFKILGEDQARRPAGTWLGFVFPADFQTQPKVLGDFKAEALSSEAKAQIEAKVEPTSAGPDLAAAAKARMAGAGLDGVEAAKTNEEQAAAQKELSRALSTYAMKVQGATLPGVNFDLSTAAELNEKSKRSLDYLGKLLEKTEIGTVRIIAYAQDPGIAKLRAEAVVKYLKGNFRMDPERLRPQVGAWASKPANSALQVELEPGK
jgi:outer membrane protein OmpA-like peptidoglycan-associated protein